jgi:hypothetical protein
LAFREHRDASAIVSLRRSNPFSPEEMCMFPYRVLPIALATALKSHTARLCRARPLRGSAAHAVTITVIAAILTMSSLARAGTSGMIFVDPNADDYLGYPDTRYCSFWGAMNQAVTGIQDEGCLVDVYRGQGYGGTASGYPNGWTELVIPVCDYISINANPMPSWVVKSTSVYIVSSGSSSECGNDLATLNGNAMVNASAFQVGTNGYLYLESIELTNYSDTPLVIQDSTGTLSLDTVWIDNNFNNGNGPTEIENNGGTLYVDYSRIFGNQGSKGILQQASPTGQATGYTSIYQTSMTGNTSFEYAGGVDNYAGQMTLEMVTIGNNRVDVEGGGIFNRGVMNVEWSTIVQNQITQSGGQGAGIYNLGTILVSYSIISDNINNGASQDCAGSGFDSGGYNVRGTCSQLNTPTDFDGAADPYTSLQPGPNGPIGPEYYFPELGSAAYGNVPASNTSCQEVYRGNCNSGAWQGPVP